MWLLVTCKSLSLNLLWFTCTHVYLIVKHQLFLIMALNRDVQCVHDLVQLLLKIDTFFKNVYSHIHHLFKFWSQQLLAKQVLKLIGVLVHKFMNALVWWHVAVTQTSKQNSHAKKKTV